MSAKIANGEQLVAPQRGVELGVTTVLLELVNRARPQLPVAQRCTCKNRVGQVLPSRAHIHHADITDHLTSPQQTVFLHPDRHRTVTEMEGGNDSFSGGSNGTCQARRSSMCEPSRGGLLMPRGRPRVHAGLLEARRAANTQAAQRARARRIVQRSMALPAACWSLLRAARLTARRRTRRRSRGSLVSRTPAATRRDSVICASAARRRARSS